MTTTDNPTHNENWIALDKAQQQDATQTDILAQAIDDSRNGSQTRRHENPI